MKNKELAEAFAKGATKGRGSNMYIREDTIYSYGPHFRIARRIPRSRGVWLTNRSFSKSTSRHIALVCIALCKRDKKIIRMELQ